MFSSSSKKIYSYIEILPYNTRKYEAIGIDFGNNVPQNGICFKIPIDIGDKEFILFERTILYPIKISKRREDKTTRFLSSNTMISNFLELVPGMIKLHNKSLEQESYFTEMFPENKQMMLRQLNGHWDKLFGKFVSLKKLSSELYSFKHEGFSYVMCSHNGKWRRSDMSSVKPFIEFFEKEIGQHQKIIWKNIEDLCAVPEMRMEEIVCQEGEYYHNSGKKFKQLTNWEGEFTNKIIDDNENCQWVLRINDCENIMLAPAAIHMAQAFQAEIARRGMYFFFGNDTELKKLIYHIFQESEGSIVVNQVEDICAEDGGFPAHENDIH